MCSPHNSRLSKEEFKGWVMAIKKAGPLSHFCTMTFRPNPDGSAYSYNASVRSFNHLICRLNRKLFGHKGTKRGESIKGWCFIENHSNEGIHFHFLVVEDAAFFIEGKPSFEAHYLNALRSLVRYPTRKTKGGPLCFASAQDCQPIPINDPIQDKTKYYGRKKEKLASYVLKEVHKDLKDGTRNMHRINAITPIGISPYK